MGDNLQNMENQGGITTYHKKKWKTELYIIGEFLEIKGTLFQKKDERHGGILSTDLGRNLHMSRTIQTFLKGAAPHIFRASYRKGRKRFSGMETHSPPS